VATYFIDIGTWWMGCSSSGSSSTVGVYHARVMAPATGNGNGLLTERHPFSRFM
jgi:hypothetical protein